MARSFRLGVLAVADTASLGEIGEARQEIG
jgi:hypothetical protein